MRLEPGDVVLTGTPEGVALSGRFPYLQPGDVVEVEVVGLEVVDIWDGDLVNAVGLVEGCDLGGEHVGGETRGGR